MSALTKWLILLTLIVTGMIALLLWVDYQDSKLDHGQRQWISAKLTG